jgi:hypothetical protein
MRGLWKTGAACIVFSYFAACSPVKFEKAPEPACGAEGIACVQKCSGDSCFQDYAVDRTVGEGMVDVLFVDDNSGSMSYEQSKMADRFPDFLASLANLDYRVAITTTDVSNKYTSTPIGVKNRAGAFNGNGALQDGNLISFGTTSYLDRSTPNKEALFNQEIKRNETIHCEQSGYTECPSSDERGIFAANLVLDRTASQFMRPVAHLAVIFLTDEDERGMSDQRSAHDDDDRALIQMYPVENYDLPDTFLSRFKSRYPGKTVSAHSIIVRPGDSGCVQAQSAQGSFVRGVEGYSYAKLSQDTGGIIGSICDADYGAQLRDIGNYLQKQVLSLPFACRPEGDAFKITLDPQPAGNIDAEADFTNMQLNIKTPLAPLTKVHLEYRCVKPI